MHFSWKGPAFESLAIVLMHLAIINRAAARSEAAEEMQSHKPAATHRAKGSPTPTQAKRQTSDGPPVVGARTGRALATVIEVLIRQIAACYIFLITNRQRASTHIHTFRCTGECPKEKSAQRLPRTDAARDNCTRVASLSLSGVEYSIGSRLGRTLSLTSSQYATPSNTANEVSRGGGWFASMSSHKL